jgi:hypothetical protein
VISMPTVKKWSCWLVPPECLLEICDVVLRLLAATVVHSVILHKDCGYGYASINGTSLAYLMEKCQSLKALTLKDLALDEPRSGVLGTYSRPDLEIVLDSCKFTSAGVSALVEVLGRDQGPTKLHSCYIDYCALEDGLHGNSRLKSLLLPLPIRHVDDDRELLALDGALPENKGLVELTLECILGMSNESWDAICGSLETHPTLQVLHLWSAPMPGGSPFFAPAVLKSRKQALVDMLKVNMSIHTIHLTERYEHELYQASVIPYLATNRLRPHVSAIQKTLPITYRAKVLGSTLLAFRNDSNAF